MELFDDITKIKNIGEKRALLLNKVGINTVNDLISYYPRTYDDRGYIVPISDMDENVRCSIKATIYGKVSSFTKGYLTITKVDCVDDSGITTLTFYNRGYVKSVLKDGETFIFYGKAVKNGKKIMLEVIDYTKNLQEYENLKIVPIYNITKGLSQTVLRNSIKAVLDEFDGRIQEYLPRKILNEYNLVDIDYATKKIHFPKDDDEFFCARNRLVFDELFFMKGAMDNIKGHAKKVTNIKMNKVSIDDFNDNLPFELTSDQNKVVDEVINDFYTGFNMNRLICGDVGSGKTVVSSKICYYVIKNGYQCAIMAPTEVLANQHYKEFTKFLEPFGIKVGFLSGSLTAKQKKQIKEQIKNGEIDMVVGTHAIIQKDVIFKNLGISITDEQHRFGVRQRGNLNEKAHLPHMLVLTATPIPRTLGLILYGDLDISTIRSMPKGRQKIDTFVVNSSYKERIFNFIKKEVDLKNSVYVVCPLIEENEKSSISSVLSKKDELVCYFGDSLVVKELHGKMKDSEKQEIMQDFKNGIINVLISTTVIEVGVDCKDATLMIVFDADRFGLSQLHQLRGRVGRADKKSYCILVSDKKKKETRQRLKIMEQTSDGFILSEKDLELRGHGEFFGNRQHGVSDSKIANLYEDIPILKKTTKLWEQIYLGDFSINENEILKNKINEIEKTINTVYL